MSDTARAHDDYAAIVETVSYTQPAPLPEDPPLVDELTAYVCWACSKAVGALERIDEMQDHVDR